MKTKDEAKVEAQQIVSNWSLGAAVLGWIPGSTLVFAGGDMMMVRQVAEKFGIQSFDEEGFRAHLGGVVASLVGGTAAAGAAEFVPIIGWAAKAAVLSAKSKVLGEAVIDYFYSRSPLP